VAPLNLDKVGEVAGKAVEGTKDVVEGAAKGVTDAVSDILGK